MSNRLEQENSPYLIQHADNPVDWFPWGPEALELAKLEDKPIFLSIGYAACHWCHVMAHESFEDIETARLMNDNFVNIKVDREERPDLDSIYMDAVVALTGSGGWPMSVFLTPDGKPFFGGTYFPPVPRYRMPSFREVLLTVARLWKEDRGRLLESGENLMRHLTDNKLISTPDLTPDLKLSPHTLEQAVFRLAQSYDWENGGWGQAPKFPQPMLIEFLLVRAVAGDRIAQDMARHALDAMARGGMYDVIGGGFARYSTDDQWLVPHFEKMLYDNAQLAMAYLHAFIVTGNTAYRDVCTETLDFILRELSDPAGGFYSSLDADSEGEEGKFYIWSFEEIQSILQAGSSEDQDWPIVWKVDPSVLFCTAYGITPSGSFEGKNIPSRQISDQELAQGFGLSEVEVASALSYLRRRIFKARMSRILPGLDDKVLVSWNALALAAFSEAGRYLKRDDYLLAAQKNANFILTQMQRDGLLLRSWRSGSSRHNAYLEDYAGLIIGLVMLYQLDSNLRWFTEASRLAAEMLKHYRDPAGGFFDTRDDHETLILRPKDFQDNATPSGGALAAMSLILLSAFTGNSEWRQVAEQMAASISEIIIKYPTGFGKWLHALSLLLNPFTEIAIIGELEGLDTEGLIAIVLEEYRPHAVLAVSPYPIASESPTLLQGRIPIDGKATAFVCRNFSCLLPTTLPNSLRMQLKASAKSA